VSLFRELNYDRKNRYTLEVVAVDGGVPRSLSGTATLIIDVLNKNDKTPIFSPATQRAHITEDAEPGTRVIALTASDPDATSGDIIIINLMNFVGLTILAIISCYVNFFAMSHALYI
jgi:hypothetical protein